MDTLTNRVDAAAGVAVVAVARVNRKTPARHPKNQPMKKVADVVTAVAAAVTKPKTIEGL